MVLTDQDIDMIRDINLAQGVSRGEISEMMSRIIKTFGRDKTDKPLSQLPPVTCCNGHCII